MATDPMTSGHAWSWQKKPANNQPAFKDNTHKPSMQLTEVYNSMKGFLKSTHWSKPYYSALVHNNPQLPYHLLEHVNCTYLSTPGRAPTLLALKQHAQSLAVLISLLAPAQHGGALEPPNEGKANGDAPFAAEQAFDWLNDLQEHYSTEDTAHKKPLNALVNLIKSNSDTQGPKWHCPLDTAEIELAEKHPFQQYRPYETHLTLLMHANEILERLDHEYSAMGGILGIIPLDSDKVDEQRALTHAKTTLVGQWILFTQHLVARMHELEIAYGNTLDLLANEAVVPLQHISIHGPDGRSGREIIFPQDRWILANAGEDVFTFVHRMLDRAEAHQDAQDDVFEEQKVLGDAAFTNNKESKHRGIVKVDLNTRFYRLRKSGHGPLFVLPAFGDRPNTKHTRDMENRPTVVTIPQPSTKNVVNAWESQHKDIDVKLLRLSVDKSNLEAKVSQLNSSIEMREREIQRLLETEKQFQEKLSDEDISFVKQNVYLNDSIRYLQKLLQEGGEREKALKQDVENFKQANITAQNGDAINPLVGQINEQQAQIRALQKEIQDGNKKREDLARDNDTLRILNNPTFSSSAKNNSEQVKQLKDQLASCQQERQMMQQEIHSLKKSKGVKGKILNFDEGFNLEYGSTFEDSNRGIIACNTVYFRSLLAAENERNDLRQQIDGGAIDTHGLKAKMEKCKAEREQLRKENEELKGNGQAGTPARIINLPWGLQYTSTFRDDNQGLIVLRTDWYDYLLDANNSLNNYKMTIAEQHQQIKDLKTPADVNVAGGSLDSYKEQLAQYRAIRDTDQNIAVVELSYFDELETADATRQVTQNRLNECQKNSQTLQQQLDEARSQLQQAVQNQNNDASAVPDLQLQVENLENALKQSLEERKQLEAQVTNLLNNAPAADLNLQINDLQTQVAQNTQERQKVEGELAELQKRYKKLQLNESNLRTEVASLRQRLSEALKKADGNGGNQQSTGQGSNDLQAAQAEINLYREELGTLQKIWNDLQTQHVQLQQRFKAAQQDCDEEKKKLLEGARQDCDEQKKLLQQQLNEANQNIQVLQMKVIADPNKLQPAMIQIEAQRDAARKQRDELHGTVIGLQQQLRQQKMDCEKEKSELQAKINQQGT